jgi:hypothetical protein
MLLEGHVEDGRIVVDDPANLPDGTKVRLQVVATVPPGELPTLYERLKPIIGIAKHLPDDAAHNHDHYLYGAPKKP